MKNIIKKVTGYTLIFISIALIMFMLGDKMSTDIHIPYQGTVVLLCLVAVFAITGTVLLASILNRKELKINMMHTILWVIFLAYIITLLKVLFIDRTGMSSTSVIYHEDMRDINLIPFTTIKLFIRSWHYGYLTKGLIVSNIIGNVLIFLPMVILLWSMFKIMRKKYILLAVNFLLIVGVEIAQYITGFGSCDVDDVLLNMIGVILGYILVRRKFFENLCKKIYIIE